MVKQKKSEQKTVNKNTITPKQQRTLRTCNLWLAGVFFVQALAIVIIGTAKTAPVTTNYLAIDPLASEAAGEQTLAVATRYLFDVRLAWVVAAFLLVFAAIHLLAATTLRRRYEARLQAEMNDLRWIGLGVGGGSMVLAVALVSGITEVASLVMLFALMLFGAIAVLGAEELRHRNRQQKMVLSHVMCLVGFGSMVMPWVVFGLIAGSALLYDGNLPAYICGIYISMFVLFVVGFVLTHFRLKRKGIGADTFRAENAYMLFGVVTASALAWQIFAGTLLP